MTLLNHAQSQLLPRDRMSASPASARAMGRCRMLSFVRGCVLLLVASFLVLAPLAAQEDEESAATRENRIKAAYLYQFGRYVEWPATAFASSKSPFVIGVLEQDPLIPDLEQIARIKKLKERPIQIRRFASTADMEKCNILYLPASLAPEAQVDIIRKTKGHNILLVGESPGFVEWGGIMQFAAEENKIRVVISRKAAERAGLSISAKLLQVARVLD